MTIAYWKPWKAKRMVEKRGGWASAKTVAGELDIATNTARRWLDRAVELGTLLKDDSDWPHLWKLSSHCGHCHHCGARMLKYLDGEEWCPHCKMYRRYRSHGWGLGVAETREGNCPVRPFKDEPSMTVDDIWGE